MLPAVALIVLGNCLQVASKLFLRRSFGIAPANRGVKVGGPYRIVRHPMYVAALVMMLAVPIALGSWWGELMFPLMLGGIVWRLVDEERMLESELAGYLEYEERVRYRLIPGVW